MRRIPHRPKRDNAKRRWIGQYEPLNLCFQCNYQWDIVLKHLPLLWHRARTFVSFVRRSTKASEELRVLQRQQVLKDTPQGASAITDPEEDQAEENEGEPEAGYTNENRLTRVLALRSTVDTRWNSVYYLIERCGAIVLVHELLLHLIGVRMPPCFPCDW